MSALQFAQGYDRWMAKRGPLGAAMRFAMSVPGQVLVNTAVFRLPDELRMVPTWQVLDIGCGRAGALRVVAERASLERPPVGLDASARMLELGRRDIERDAGPPVMLAQGAATALPFADGRFDLLLSGHALKYLSDDDLCACLSEARRALKPGGIFVAWEFAPTKSRLLDRWNAWVLGHEVSFERLRGYRELQSLAYECGFDYVQPAQLRPFLLPPIPRVSLLMGRAPEGWRRTMVGGRSVLEHVGDEG